MIISNILRSLTALLCFVALSASSQEVTSQPHIEIVTEHLPPFQIDTPNKVLGFATEIVSSALSSTPYTFNISVYPWARSLNMALNKANTCIYSIARTPAREQQFIWVNTIAERNVSFIGLTARKLSITSLDDAKKYMIAVIRDDVTHQLLVKKGFIEGLNLFVVNNTHSLLMLLAKRKSIDLILADGYTIKYRAQFNNLNPNLFENVYQLNTKPLDYYFACNIKTPPYIIEQLRHSINQLKITGKIDKIISEWQYPVIRVN
ncbi:substrate-binding periplasmic protein [Colwellia hornerae]|uniref:substrate-binding periplasmic protein n=1 Tax=Colwellia hornerae TaxID=89402 RepID=UPI001479658A|nr:transporter substrate-binding domain-containing protein [Colwellia hornerae]